MPTVQGLPYSICIYMRMYHIHLYIYLHVLHIFIYIYVYIYHIYIDICIDPWITYYCMPRSATEIQEGPTTRHPKKADSQESGIRADLQRRHGAQQFQPHPLKVHGCFCKWGGGPFCAPTLKALLFGVDIRASDFGEAPYATI